MADNLTATQGDILTIDVGNNILVCNPNKIVGAGGEEIDRLVPSEDLVMYAKLYAYIQPRSYAVGGAHPTTLTIAATNEGKLDFLNPANKSSLDTDWTDAFTTTINNSKSQTQNSDFQITLLAMELCARTHYENYFEILIINYYALRKVVRIYLFI